MKYFDEMQCFQIIGVPIKIEPYGEGHINETYYVETDQETKYILQKINERLFTDIPALMRNIKLVTEHIAKKNEQAGNGEIGLTLIKNKAGMPFIKTENGYFRVYDFIDNATAHQIVSKPEQFYESAIAFGDFQNKLSDFDASLLTEVLPDFHNTEKRLCDFEASLKKDAYNRAVDVGKEIEFVLSRVHYTGKIVSLLSSGYSSFKKRM